MKKIWVREAVLEKAHAGDYARPSPALVRNFQDVDLKNVTGLGALNEYRPGKRVDAFAVDVDVFAERHPRMHLRTA